MKRSKINIIVLLVILFLVINYFVYLFVDTNDIEKNIDNVWTVSFIFLLVIFYFGSIYFRKKRQDNIESGKEKEILKLKISKNTVIQCDNNHKKIFFKCRYKGKPSKNMPFFFWLTNFPFPRSVTGMTISQWKEYNSSVHHYCPKCGKRLFDHNIAN